jgi:4-amino-4-deoxy-L-arabinose transferase-like glycosyltransferase
MKKYLTPVNIILFLLLAFALFLRINHTGTILGFWYDQGRDAQVIWDFLHKGKFFLIGPTTGIEGIFRGPWYYWLIAPIYFISGGDPTLPAMFLAATTVVAIYFTYKIGERLGGVKTGLLAAFVTSLSYYLATAARWLSNPTPMFLISVLTIWFLLRFIDGKKNSLTFIGLLAGLAIQFGSAAEVFYIPTIAILLFMYRKKIKSFGKLILPGLVFALIFAPQVIFNIRHHGIFFDALKKFLVEEQSFKLSFWQTLKVRLPFYLDMISSKFWLNGIKLFAPFVGAVIAALILYWKEMWKKDVFKVVFMFSVAPLLGMLFFQGNQGNVYEYYFSGYFYIWIILFSYALTTLANSFAGKVVLASFLAIFIYKNFLTTFRYAAYTGNEGPSAIYLSNQKEVIDWIYKDVGSTPFNVDVYVPPVIPHAYNYLFEWYGGVVKGRAPNIELTERLYTIYEIDPPHPERLEAWMKRQATIGKVVSEFRSGGITVQRRIRITK